MKMKNDWDYRAFAVKHNYDVKDLLLAYSFILIEAINVIWENIEWKVKKVRKHYRIKDAGILKNKELKKALRSRKTKYRAKKDCIEVEYEVERLMPGIPASREFKRVLRDRLMKEWRKRTDFAAHYVDSAVKQAYSMFKSWKKNYRKGRARRRKPVIRRRFIRIKETLFTYEDGVIRITIAPKKYLNFEIPGWVVSKITKFLGRKPEKADFGELILKENELIIVVRKPKKGYGRKIAIDTNMNSIDGFDPAEGFFTKDISGIRKIAEAYDEQITRLQSYERKKPSLREKRRKLLRRRNCRIENGVHIKANELVEKHKSCLFVFEELDKREMFRNSFDRKRAAELVREIKSVKIDWNRVRKIVEELEEEPNRRKVEELNKILTKVYSPSVKKLMKRFSREAYEKYRRLWKLSFELKRCWNYHSRRLHQTVWRRIHKTIEYKAGAEYVPPHKTTRTCPRCGGDVKLRNGQVVCDCKGLGVGKPFVLNRHYSASLNIYFLSWGFPPGPSAFYRFLIRDGTCRRLAGRGVALCGCEPHDVPPMNPEGDEGDVHQGVRGLQNAHVR